MPFLTKEDYEMIPEGLRERLQKAEQDYDVGLKTRDELTQAFTKIYSDPGAVKMVRTINDKLKLGLNIPDSPLNAYVEPLEKEIKDLKKEKQEEYQAETKKLVKEKFEFFEIPFTKEKADEIDRFRVAHAISDSREGYLSAIDLWAKEREPEPVSAEYKKPFSFTEAPNEESAMNNALKEIREFKKSQLRR